MDVLFPTCAALDLHKDSIVACRVRTQTGKRLEEVRRFGTMTDDLLALSDWLGEWDIPIVAMESTGVYWQPVYNILEGNFEAWVVNAHHLKTVPGRKTDVKDARWIAKCLEHGLLNPSFVPETQQREMRDLTRMRIKLIQDRASYINRVQKILEPCNIKLASVATDVLGVSGRAMLDALAAGETDTAKLADMAKGRMRSKKELLMRALNGRVSKTHRLVLTELLRQIDSIDGSLNNIEDAIKELMAPFDEAVSLLTTIPGVGRDSAQAILAETGTDMSHWATAEKLCAWGGTAPGNNESAGKKKSGKTRQGNQTLRTSLVQCARVAVKANGTYYQAMYNRLVKRRGDGRAIMAVAHSILKTIYYMLTRNTTYIELGADHFQKQRPDAIVRECLRRLKSCGFDTMLTQSYAEAV